MARDREDNYEAADKALVSRWEREKERSQLKLEHAKEVVEETLTKMLRNKNVKSNVATDLKRATQNPYKQTFDGFRRSDDDDAEIAEWLRNRSQYVEEDDE